MTLSSSCVTGAIKLAKILIYYTLFLVKSQDLWNSFFTVSVSHIRIPNHTIVNIEAVGGNQAAKDSKPVEAAATSIKSLPVSRAIR